MRSLLGLEGLAGRAQAHPHRGEAARVRDLRESFTQKASLHVHKSFHSNRFPHKCPQCEQSFRRKQELDKHVPSIPSKGRTLATWRETVPYQRLYQSSQGASTTAIEGRAFCTVCGARFSQQRYLESHRKNLHAATRSMA